MAWGQWRESGAVRIDSFLAERVDFVSLNMRSVFIAGACRGDGAFFRVQVNVTCITFLFPINHLVCSISSLSFLLPIFYLQLIIGFESGIVALWDLKSKKADYRYTHDEVSTPLSPAPILLQQLSVIPATFA